jgi:hypothetical protein
MLKKDKKVSELIVRCLDAKENNFKEILKDGLAEIKKLIPL